ncbi:unnamed protein product [Moneuplotes crassus]|uniref:Uncharacterized protein n=1 Tax=Euplotes crassus TaxID=5936 RepID=A0AAD1XT70_EUPCR|nr:unnamed protein product [Moneuplotes crassus]
MNSKDSEQKHHSHFNYAINSHQDLGLGLSGFNWPLTRVPPKINKPCYKLLQTQGAPIGQKVNPFCSIKTSMSTHKIMGSSLKYISKHQELSAFSLVKPRVPLKPRNMIDSTSQTQCSSVRKPENDPSVDEESKDSPICNESEQISKVLPRTCKPSINLSKHKMDFPKKKPQSDTNTRDDVLHKTLFRAVKKFYSQECCNTRHVFAHSKNQESQILQKIDQVCKTRFASLFSEAEIEKAAPLELLALDKKQLAKFPLNDFFMAKLMVASISARMIMKKYIGKYEVRKVYVKYYNVLNKYSYGKLVNLLTLKPFQTVFKEFLTSSEFAQMLREDKTLKKHHDLYKAKAQEFLEIIGQMEADTY